MFLFPVSNKLKLAFKAVLDMIGGERRALNEIAQQLAAGEMQGYLMTEVLAWVDTGHDSLENGI